MVGLEWPVKPYCFYYKYIVDPSTSFDPLSTLD